MKALNNQSLLDLAIQAAGHVEGVVVLAQENGLSVTAELTPGDDVTTISATLVDADIQNYYTTRKVRPATDAEVAAVDECDYCQYFM